MQRFNLCLNTAATKPFAEMGHSVSGSRGRWRYVQIQTLVSKSVSWKPPSLVPNHPLGLDQMTLIPLLDGGPSDI